MTLLTVSILLRTAERFLALLKMREGVDQTPPHRPASEGCKYSPEALTDYF